MLGLDHVSIKYKTHNITFCYSNNPLETSTYTRYNEIASLLEFDNNPIFRFSTQSSTRVEMELELELNPSKKKKIPCSKRRRCGNRRKGWFTQNQR